uniref:LON peptidase N-terminal domain and ring finger 2 n=1 Tax=Leptobrachium leishanense TaxID=445787 RepID=A0A8C5W7P0_9ANUR
MKVRSVPSAAPLPMDLPGLSPEMLEVAEEAFRAGNFELAAEIYGSQLEELPQPERALYLRKGDALALAGKTADALDCYAKVSMLGSLCPEELAVLVENIALNIREKELKLPRFNTHGVHCPLNEPYQGTSASWTVTYLEGPPESSLSIDLFSCPKCKLLLLDPVTLNCGHTFCKNCLCGSDSVECTLCRSRYSFVSDGLAMSCEGLRVNVVLGNLMEKWLSQETEIRRLSVEGESLRQNSNFAGAVEKLTKALELAPGDSMLAVQRAELHLSMKSFKQALIDADAVCRKHLLWPKIMCDLLFPGFENVQVGLATSLGTPPSYARLKPAFTNSTNSSLSVKDVHLAGGSKDSLFRLTKAASLESDLLQMKDFLDLPVDDALKTIGNVLSCLPSTGLKRKHGSTLEEPHSRELTAKFPKTDAESTCKQKTTGPRVREIPMARVDASDFECSLCMRLFYEPVATPCGHTFCLKCLERCLDHNSHCPLCKENLSKYLASRAYKKTYLTEDLIKHYLPEDLEERKKLHDEEIQELSNLNKDVPIFVCTMAFPTIPCPLHVFEPRYRLMIRRSIETGTKQFGMCIADELKGFADYGCMLHVRDVKFFPDGRSVVDTVGLKRFKVLSHGQRDGYHTANIEYLADIKVEGQEYEELLVLHNSVYDQALVWFTSLKDNLKAQILSHFGPMPSKESEPQVNSSGPAWCWWMLAVLPLENKAQLTILAMTSLKDRLLAIRRVLMFVTRKRPR